MRYGTQQETLICVVAHSNRQLVAFYLSFMTQIYIYKKCHITKAVFTLNVAFIHWELCGCVSWFPPSDQRLRSWELATSRQMHLIHIKGNQWSLSPTSKCHSGKTQEDELSQAEGREEGGAWGGEFGIGWRMWLDYWLTTLLVHHSDLDEMPAGGWIINLE